MIGSIEYIVLCIIDYDECNKFHLFSFMKIKNDHCSLIARL